jgi:hypothetical protein
MNELSERPKTETDANSHRQEVLTTEINFELLRQYAWFSSAVIGAVIVLMQAGVVENGAMTYIAISLISVATFASIIGQSYIAESLLKGKTVFEIANTLNRVRTIAMFFMGMGGGSLFANRFLF